MHRPEPNFNVAAQVIKQAAQKPDNTAIIFVGTRLARYKLPLRLNLVEALPRNPAGKVLKFQLRESLA